MMIIQGGGSPDELAHIAGTGVSVKDVIVLRMQGYSLARLMIHLNLSRTDVSDALFYYAAHQEEIDDLIHEERIYFEHLRRHGYPLPPVWMRVLLSPSIWWMVYKEYFRHTHDRGRAAKLAYRVSRRLVQQ